jgi:hypothetical protein
MARGRQARDDKTAAAKTRGRIAAAVGTAGAAGEAGLSEKIQEAMGQAAAKAQADGRDVHEQRRAMGMARKRIVEEHAKAANEASKRASAGEE